jgi:hypothetical protein
MTIQAFTGKDGLLWCVTATGTRVHGPFTCKAEVRAIAPLIRDHERGCEVARMALTPQPLSDADVLDAFAR